MRTHCCFGRGVFVVVSTLAVAACGTVKDDTGGGDGETGTIAGRLGGSPDDSARRGDPSGAPSVGTTAVAEGETSLDGVEILLVDVARGNAIATATSDATGTFSFDAVPVGSYTLQIAQDEFADAAYAVDSEVVEVEAGATVTIGLPVVSRYALPAFPSPTLGSPVALDSTTGRIFMAIDQGLLVLDPSNDTLDLLYSTDGFRSDKGPRLLTYVEEADKLVIVTSTRVWGIADTTFTDPDASEVINYDDPATQEALADSVQFFDIEDPDAFIDTTRNDGDGNFDPHYYRFNTTATGDRLYVAAGGQAAAIDLTSGQVARVFLSSGRMAHYSATSNRLFFLQEPNTIRIIDADTLLEVANHDLSDENPVRLLGVSSRPSTGDGYIAYTRLNTSNEEVLFLMVVDPDGEVLNSGRASELLGAGNAPMEPGVPHWLPSGDRFIVGDSLFILNRDTFQPVATGAIIGSTLSANSVTTNIARSADVANSILVSFLGEDNAALGFYFLDDSAPDTGIRVVRGRVPVVTIDDARGRAVVFGDGALSVISYQASAGTVGAALVDLSNVGTELLGGGAGTPCDSATPCPDGGICAPVDEFNTDEGTCTPQIRNPYRVYCGGIGGVMCDPGFECDYYNPTNPQSAGECTSLPCNPDSPCPDGYVCGGDKPGDGTPPPGGEQCPPEDPECWNNGPNEGVCSCFDLALCGPTCGSDDECPSGLLCSDNGHCAVDRCLSDEACSDGKICGVTDIGRACVDPGTGSEGDSCIASTGCASGYCRAGQCVQSCAKTSECAASQDCMGGEWVGYCAESDCNCGPDDICYDGNFCEQGANCAVTSDCPGTDVCAWGRCRTSCGATDDCGSEETCVQRYLDEPTLFCSPNNEDGGSCWSDKGDGTGGQPGCPGDTWCSEYGQCMTGTPCYDWMPESCADGQSCINSVCQQTCESSTDCVAGFECTGGWASGYAGDGLLLTCQPASCNCPNNGDICITWDPNSLGECWNWTDCTNTGVCPDEDNYRCEASFEGSSRCRCEQTDVCGPRCMADSDCQDFYACNLDTGTCAPDVCDTDTDCDSGKVCGLLQEGYRACVTAGPRAPGAPCDMASQCSTGTCIWNDMGGSGGQVCALPCAYTSDCPGSDTCAVMDNGGGQPGAEPPKVCYDLDFTCAGDEFAVERWGMSCTDGTTCDQNLGNNDCPELTECRWSPGTSQYCVCSAPACADTCTTDDDCSGPQIKCNDGLCRPRPRCVADTDCETGEVCGLIDGSEEGGPRCVQPGSGAIDASCTLHAQCAGGFCSEGACAQRCDVTSDCPAGQECAAQLVASGSDNVIGACAAAACSCAGDEACNTGGDCAPGPLCNSDAECGNQEACVDNFCRATCERTGDCGTGMECIGVDPRYPHICLPASCGCGADEVCDGGYCFAAQPCTDDTHCIGGGCVGGQCYENCNATTECPNGLECVSVPRLDWDGNPMPWDQQRLCTAPVCDCMSTDTWCSPPTNNGGAGGEGTTTCFVGTSCDACNTGTDPAYQCQWVPNTVDGLNFEACACTDLESCGPTCETDTDCPYGRLCSSGACVVVSCESDTDCPDTTVCGIDQDHWPDRVCVEPGPKVNGSSCGWNGECSSGACLGGVCGNLCSTTADCAAGDVCSYGTPISWDMSVCTAAVASSCPSGCGDGEWCYQGGCYSGTACFQDNNACGVGAFCNYPVCETMCDSSLDCDAAQECVATDPWANDLVSAAAVCRVPECNCKNGEDRCRSDADWGGTWRECFRPVICNFLTPCDGTAGADYRCDDSALACVCDNLTSCGPQCNEHSDCGHGQVCDTTTNSCVSTNCQRDSDCPTGAVCGWQDYSSGNQRTCSAAGAAQDGSSCDQWSDCASGMCFQNVCVNPCVDDSECASGSECRVYQNGTFPFCMATSVCSCTAGQFCDVSGSCVTGPACNSGSDCGTGWCDTWTYQCNGS